MCSANLDQNTLEVILASIESGGVHALTFASGSATTATVLQSVSLNAHTVSINDMYGGTFRYMTRVACEYLGLKTAFVDLEQVISDAIWENTKVLLSLIHSFI